jgi:hypothetical protein
MDKNLYDNLVNFVIRQSVVNDEEITEKTRIVDDLGVNGDDGPEFMIAYGKEFSVDVSRFMAAEYFDGEGDIILPAIIRMIAGKEKRQRKILTVDHLSKGLVWGRLDEEIINDK